jgi:hypothetical protein
MANRLQKFFESIVYAGMTPAGSKAQTAPDGKSGPFDFLERFLSAPAPDDPLYLSNQTFGQKAKRMLVIAAPLALVIAGLLVIVLLYGPARKAPRQLTSAEIAAKILPNFNDHIKLEVNKDLEVVEVHVDDSGVMVGNLKNTSTHPIQEAVVVFDLVDADRSQLGGVTITETNLQPGSMRKFQKPIEQRNAALALVREVRTQ